MITVMRLLFALGLALMAAMRDAVSCIDVGNDVIKCRLEVVQDVSLEVGSINYNYLEWLMLADLPDYPLKRSLLQFEDLPATDGCEVKHIHAYWRDVLPRHYHLTHTNTIPLGRIQVEKHPKSSPSVKIACSHQNSQRCDGTKHVRNTI